MPYPPMSLADANLLFNSAGDVGIKTDTLAPFSSSVSFINLGSNKFAVGATAAGSGFFLSNLYFDGNWRYVSDGPGSAMTVQNGSILWYTATSGLADDVAPLIEVLSCVDGDLKMSNLPTYADDTEAGAGGLTADMVYKTATGELRIKL